MASIKLSAITHWSNPYSQRVSPSSIFQHLVTRRFPVQIQFLVRPRLLTRTSTPIRG
jgi:phenylalanine-4-hydroxylase